jgi:hypothetical protein
MVTCAFVPAPILGPVAFPARCSTLFHEVYVIYASMIIYAIICDLAPIILDHTSSLIHSTILSSSYFRRLNELSAFLVKLVVRPYIFPTFLRVNYLPCQSRQHHGYSFSLVPPSLIDLERRGCDTRKHMIPPILCRWRPVEAVSRLRVNSGPPLSMFLMPINSPNGTINFFSNDVRFCSG